MFGATFLGVFLLVSQVFGTNDTNGNRKGRDSYLEALKVSHSGIKSDRDYSPNVETVNSVEFPYPPSDPSPQYGPPINVYGPPKQSYGSPVPVYGPPQQQVFYGMPHAMLGLLDKVKMFKLDLYTMGKILLKIVIFKKIVSLLAILCLLLFIPSLKPKNGSNNSSSEDDSTEDMMMMKRNIDGNTSLSNLSAFVLEAIEKFGRQQNGTHECDTIYCKTQKVLTAIDKKINYKKLIRLYSKENTLQS